MMFGSKHLPILTTVRKKIKYDAQNSTDKFQNSDVKINTVAVEALQTTVFCYISLK